MKYIPILFNTEMVHANLEGLKTQTRRTKGLEEINKDPDQWYLNDWFASDEICIFKKNCETTTEVLYLKEPCSMGDVLWVRETFTEWPKGIYQYYASTALGNELGKWKPSIHMPKKAARIFLKVKSVRLERLNDISHNDAIAEGVYKHPDGGFMNYLFTAGHVCAQHSFESLWLKINGTGAWNKNPWVWAIEYERLEKPLDFLT